MSLQDFQIFSNLFAWKARGSVRKQKEAKAASGRTVR